MEKISWTDGVRSEVLHKDKKKRNILKPIKKGRPNRLVTTCVGTVF
jgi:hypothetical protein